MTAASRERSAVTDLSEQPPSPLPIDQRAGPTDISDPLLRLEARRAAVWLGMGALIALAVVLAEPLLVVFGGMVFGALIDGGARLIGRALPIGRGWCVAIVLVLAAAFIAWFVMFAGSQLADQAAALPETVRQQAMKLIGWAQRHGVRIDTRMQQNLTEQALGGVSAITGILGGILGGATTAFLILVLGIYFAVDPAPYRRGLAWMLPLAARDHFEGTLLQMGRSMRRLLAGRLLGMVVEGATMGAALAAFGVPMAGLLGLISGLLAFLPNIGAPISGALMIMVGFSGGTNMGLYCIVIYIVVQTIDGNVVVPMVAKRAADLAPALVLSMQLIMGALFGILGLALADPLLAMLKVLLERQGEAAHDKLAANGA
ncbi:MAG: AI-2E family transporter [Sphingomonadales bacterium]|nr:AI-2E family transporter [Sphingomonadales bacterium]